MEYGDYEVKSTSTVGTNTGNTNVSATGKQKPEVKKPLPLVEKKETNEQDKPIKGYYVETSDDDDDDDKDTDIKETTDAQDQTGNGDDDEDADIKDHEVDATARIHVNQSIAKHNENANPIINALTDTMYEDVQDNDITGKSYVKAFNMLKDENNEDDILDVVETNNKVKVYGKVIEEYSNYTLKSTGEMNIASNAQLANIGASWGKKSKSGAETKLMVFGNYTRNTDKLKIKPNEDQDTPTDDENDVIPEINEEDEDLVIELDDIPDTFTSTSNDYKAFAAVEHKFVNKDKLYGSATFYKDESTATTLNLNSKYNSNKYNAYVEGKLTLYMDKPDTEDDKGANTVVTDIKVGFNPDMTEVDNDDFEDTDNKSEENTNEETGEISQAEISEEGGETPQISLETEEKISKNWTTIKNPYFITNTVAGEPSTGIGYEQYFKRKDDNSRLTLGYFSQVSITHTNEDSKNKQEYNLAAGASLKHVARINNGRLESKIKIRDRYTIGKSNIFTASANASYNQEKISAEVDAEYVKVPESSYFGVTGRVFYNINKNVSTYVNANYIHMKDEDLIKGGTIQAGIVANF